MLLNFQWLGASCYLNFPSQYMVGFYVIKTGNISIRGTGHSIYRTLKLSFMYRQMSWNVYVYQFYVSSLFRLSDITFPCMECLLSDLDPYT